MGNVDKLLDALAQRLPRTADRKALSAALRAAADQLPAGQTKTKVRLLKSESACIRKLEQRLRDTDPSEDAASADEEREEPQATPCDGGAGYAGVSSRDPDACLARCSNLLRDALTSIRSVHHAQQAIEGLLALLPPEQALSETGCGHRFDIGAVQSCVQLVPLAVALLRNSDSSETPVWHRFLGFLLVAPLRLIGNKDSDSDDVVNQLGSLVALVASPQAARSALRLTLSAIGSGADGIALTRFAPAIFLIANVGFGRGGLDGADLVRGDMVALLQCMRLVGLCSNANVSSTQTLDEARDLLRVALEGHFDSALMLPELQHLFDRNAGKVPRSKVLKRRLVGAVGAGRNLVSSVVVDSVEALSSIVSALCISRLAEPCGLPIGKDERVDQRAAVARAQGDIFFEDVDGLGDDTGAVVDGADDVGAAAASAAHVHSVGRIEGVEALAKKSSATTKAKEGKDGRQRILSKRPLLQKVLEISEPSDIASKSTKRPGANKSDQGHGTLAESAAGAGSPKLKRQRKQ